MKNPMKTMCEGCPFDIGKQGTEEAYNVGCLPSVGELEKDCKENNTAWACHSCSDRVCCGFAERNPTKVCLDLEHVEGIHNVD